MVFPRRRIDPTRFSQSIRRTPDSREFVDGPMMSLLLSRSDVALAQASSWHSVQAAFDVRQALVQVINHRADQVQGELLVISLVVRAGDVLTARGNSAEHAPGEFSRLLLLGVETPAKSSE